MLARKETRALRQQKAATIIQTAYRRHKMRQQYREVLHTITQLQVGDSVDGPSPAESLPIDIWGNCPCGLLPEFAGLWQVCVLHTLHVL